jgi:hypothetical protein
MDPFVRDTASAGDSLGWLGFGPFLLPGPLPGGTVLPAGEAVPCVFSDDASNWDREAAACCSDWALQQGCATSEAVWVNDHYECNKGDCGVKISVPGPEEGPVPPPPIPPVPLPGPGGGGGGGGGDVPWQDKSCKPCVPEAQAHAATVCSAQGKVLLGCDGYWDDARGGCWGRARCATRAENLPRGWDPFQ